MHEQDNTVTLEEWLNAACGAVVEAVHDGSEQRKAALDRQIADVEQQLPADLDGLSVLLRALRRLLAGDPPSVLRGELDNWYSDVFDRVVIAIEEGPAEEDHEPSHHHHVHEHGQPTEPEGRRLNLGEALEEMVQDTVRVMEAGSHEDRMQMAQGLELLRFQTVSAMEWPAFGEFLQALQNLLRGEEIDHATDFEPPFDHAWARVSEQLPIDSEQSTVNSEQ